MAEPDDPTASEINAAANDLEVFAVRLKGIIALAGRFKSVAALINAERELKDKLAGLQRQSDEAVATRDTARRELDGLNAELGRHKQALVSDREAMLQRARADGESVLINARAKAETILAEAKAKADEQAQRQAAEAEAHGSTIRALETDIAERQTHLARIKALIAEARAKIGA